jgi:hypothetical protein
MSDGEDRLRRALLPGSSLLEDHKGRAPVVPRDIGVRATQNADGTAPCDLCSAAYPIAELEVTAHGYRCAACVARLVREAGPAELDDKNLKVGRGRWWIMPLVIVAASPIIILYPAATIVLVLAVAAFMLRLVMRRGL